MLGLLHWGGLAFTWRGMTGEQYLLRYAWLFLGFLCCKIFVLHVSHLLSLFMPSFDFFDDRALKWMRQGQYFWQGYWYQVSSLKNMIYFSLLQIWQHCEAWNSCHQIKAEFRGLPVWFNKNLIWHDYYAIFPVSQGLISRLTILVRYMS